MERIASTGWKAYRPRRLGRACWRLSALAVVALTGAAETGGGTHLDPDVLWNQARRLGTRAVAWYEVTPPTDRMVWGGLTAAAGLALGVLMERWARAATHPDRAQGIRSAVPRTAPRRRARSRQSARLLRIEPEPRRAVALVGRETLGTAGGRSRTRRRVGPSRRGRSVATECRHAAPRRRVNSLARSARHPRRARAGPWKR